MTAARSRELLLRCFPPAWRARYGEELSGLIAELAEDGRVPWRVRADLALAGLRERLRAAGLGGEGAPGERVRGGALLVLCGWALLVVAGAGFQRLSEHWQDATAAGDRALPQAAFAAVVIAAAGAAVLVLGGIAVALPRAAVFLRSGGWPLVRGHVARAALLTALAGAATIALVAWAHGLTPRGRDGHDAAYAAGFVVWAAVLAACLAAWTAVAVAIARRLALPASALRVEARLGAAVAVAMVAVTAATALWWIALAGAAPWFLAGAPRGTHAAVVSAELIAVMALMLVAATAGLAGARQAWQALPALSSENDT
jgi:hypothetical protein